MMLLRSALLLFLTIGSSYLFAQEPPTIQICGGSQEICIDEPFFDLCVTITVASDFTEEIDRFEIDWGDGSPITVVPGSNNPPNQTHEYDLSDFFGTCTYSLDDFGVRLETYLADGTSPNNAFFPTFINPPNAIIRGAPEVVCVGEEVCMTNASCPTENLSLISWDFGDGTTDPENGCHTYNTPGEYVVALSVENDCGMDMTRDTIRVIAPPTAVAQVLDGTENNASPYQVCLEGGVATVTLEGGLLSDNETSYFWEVISGTGFNWIFPDGVSRPELAEQQITFNQEGVYAIELRTDNACSQPAFDTLTFEVAGGAFSLDPQEDGCISLDYTPSTANDNVVHTINGMLVNSFPTTLGPGEYFVEVNGNSSFCANATQRDTFLVLDLETADILTPASADTVCALDGVYTFSATPENGIWRIDGTVFDGTLDPADYPPGTYTITYGNEPCITTDQVSLTIVGAALTLPTDTELCVDSPPTQFMATPAGGYWSGTGVDNAGNFDPAAVGIGDYVLTYTYDNADFPSCSNRDSFTVTVSELMVDFQVDDCSGNQLCFSLTEESSAFTSISWDFGGTGTSNRASPCYTFPAAGTYEVSVTIEAGACTVDTTRTIVIAAAPVAGFQLNLPPDRCAPLSVPVNNQASGDNLRYEWYLDGNLISEDATIDPLLLDAVGETTTYTLRQVVSNDCATDSQTETIVVEPRPLSRFGIVPQTYCSGDTLLMGNASVGNPGSYHWLLNGQQISTDSMPPIIAHQTEVADTLEVCLITENICGSDTLCQEVIVLPTDVEAFFIPDRVTVCRGDTFELTNLSTLGVPVFYQFGDGNSTSNPNPRYSYADTGTYLVRLQAFGCGYDDFELSLRVVEAPVARWQNPAFGCPGDTLQFTNESEGTMDFQWDFGDGDSSTEASPRHVFPNSGTYEVCLTVFQTEVVACSATRCQMVEIFAPPIAGFTATDSLCVNDPVAINSTAQGAGLSCDYAFGDGDFSDDCIDVHAYATGGTYLLTQIVEDTNGCRDTTAQPLFVRPLPEPAFSVEVLDPCHPSTIRLENTSTLSDAYVWDFGDGSTSTATNPEHTYAAPGNYTISLIATRDNICSASNSQQVTIFERPQAMINTSSPSLCARESVSFTSTSTGPVSSWRWDMGDGRTEFDESLSHAYATAGAYDVRLIVGTDSGCLDTTTLALTVFASASAELSMEEVTCAGFADGGLMATTLTGMAPFSYAWSNGATSPEVTDLPAGPYTLTLTDANGCQWDTTLQLLEPLPISADFRAEIVTCAGGNDGSILVETITGGQEPYTFSWEDGSTDSLWTGLAAGSYSLRVLDARGCEQMLNGEVPENTPVTYALAINPITCYGADDGIVELDSIGGGVGPYDIILQSTRSSQGGVAISRFDNLAADIYELSVTDANACQTIETIQLIEPALTSLQLYGPDTLHINCGEIIEFNASYNATNPAFRWFPERFLSCTECIDPVARPDLDVTYFVEMTTATQCVVSDTVVVLVDPVPPIYIPNAFSPNNDNINDFFEPYSDVTGIQVLRWEIYNRWGTMVYTRDPGEMNRIDMRWDGYYLDEPQNTGVYVYYLEVMMPSGKIVTLTGDVTLVK